MEWTGIAIFYFVCLVVGFVFALLGAVFGEIAGHGGIEAGGHGVEFGHEAPQVGEGAHLGAGLEADHGLEAGPVDTGHDLPGAHIFNTITICTFLAFFGLAGLLAVWVLGMSPLASLAFALPVSLIVAGVQFVLWVNFFIKAQASSEATLFDVLGCEAEVTASIPAERVGEIVYVIKGSRFTAPAVSADGEDIARGTKVRVVNARGALLVVRPM